MRFESVCWGPFLAWRHVSLQQNKPTFPELLRGL